jgi:RimJ/RimL family protein N-acetyltransferase
MEQHYDQFGQPIGPPLSNWSARQPPPRTPMTGRFCKVEPLNPERHAEDLFAANCADAVGRNWTYLPEDQGPHPSLDLYRRWAEAVARTDDPLWHTIIDRETGRAVGVAAYARIDRTSGVIEVGGINYSPRLQRRPAATEAMYLMMRRVFDQRGYRRYEWKCDSLNAPSQSAALRLGFRYEGLFRQAVVYKGRSRDTAWFSVIDSEWPALRRGFERWLDPANFDSEGRQRASLSSLRLRG